MKDVKIRVSADTAQAKKELENIQKGVKDVGEEAKETDKQVEAVGVTAGNTKVGFGMMAKAIRGVGTALKAAGIGLIVAIVVAITEAFSRNKKVMDKVNIVLGTVQEVFSQITNALVTTYEAITSTSENFDALGKVINGLITISLFPLKATFYQLLLASNALKLGYEKMFGDGESVKKAQDDLDRTRLNIIELGLEVNKAGKDIVNNFGEAVSEVGNIAEITSKSFSKVSIKTAHATATAYKQATDASILAQAEAGKLIARYDRQAEQQRQIRDDANRSIAERQEANRKLNDILDEQEKQLLKQADAVIAGARAEVAKNDSIENQAALVSALAAQEQVLADIEGKRSEQKSNTNTLLLEEKALITSVTNAERDRAKAQRDFDVEQELDPMAKVKAQREALELENQAILEDLESKRLLYKEGTQQRIDAEQEYLNKKQVLTQAVVKLDQAEADAKAATLEAVSGGIAALGKLAGENAQLQKATGIGTAIIDTYIGANKAFAQGGTAGFVTGGAIIASGLANVATILKTKLPNEAGTSQSIPQGAGAPSFNLVEGTGESQIANNINNQGGKPVKAYVTSGDITTAQQADRQAELNSGF